jgi:hypothetical protein
MVPSYPCPICGEVHVEIPRVIAEYPDAYRALSEDEREVRATLTSDTCVIDHEEFFIRALIALPITGTGAALQFDVWLTQSRTSFLRYVESLGEEAHDAVGQLATTLGCYQRPTLMMSAVARFRGQRQRPVLALDSIDHPLANDQRDGITLARAWELLHHFG